ncbi:hypothetical protein RSOL_362460, partial [Rhizoctonia solani AG-3 Rhs1AP]
MNGTEDLLAALLAAKLAEDPGYLQRSIAQAAGLVQPPFEKPTKAAHAQLGHKTIMDEEQCQEQPKRARPKMFPEHPPPAPEPTADPAPAELEDRQVTTNKRPKKKARLERVSA